MMPLMDARTPGVAQDEEGTDDGGAILPEESEESEDERLETGEEEGADEM